MYIYYIILYYIILDYIILERGGQPGSNPPMLLPQAARLTVNLKINSLLKTNCAAAAVAGRDCSF